MSVETAAALLGAIVGGAISSISAWLLQVRADRTRFDQSKKLLVTGLADDLTQTPDFFQRLVDDYARTGLVWHATIQEIVASRDTYWRNKDWIVLLPQPLRTDVFKYYVRTQQVLMMLENGQKQRDAAAPGSPQIANLDALIRNEVARLATCIPEARRLAAEIQK